MSRVLLGAVALSGKADRAMTEACGSKTDAFGINSNECLRDCHSNF